MAVVCFLLTIDTWVHSILANKHEYGIAYTNRERERERESSSAFITGFVLGDDLQKGHYYYKKGKCIQRQIHGYSY